MSVLVSRLEVGVPADCTEHAEYAPAKGTLKVTKTECDKQLKDSQCARNALPQIEAIVQQV